MKNSKNLVGQHFGKYTVIAKSYKKFRIQYWKCKCICGRTVKVQQTALLYGQSKQCKNCYKKQFDLVGKKFGKLTVVSISHKTKSNNTMWNCNCDCGNNIKIKTSELKNRKDCKFCHIRKINKNDYVIGKDNKNWKGFQEISGNRWYEIKSSATRNNKKKIFDLSIEYIWDLFIAQNRLCYFSGDLITFPKNQKERGTASLDRIDSSKGYIKGNVRWVHKYINNMKLIHSDNYFLYLIDNIINKYNKKYRELLIYKQHHNFRGYMNIGMSYWSRILRNAECLRNKKSILEFNITIEYLWYLYEKQNGKCALSNLDIDFQKRVSKYINNTASLDRIDPSKGYIMNNIQWVHKDINIMKLDYTMHDFLLWCQKIYDYSIINKGYYKKYNDNNTK